MSPSHVIATCFALISFAAATIVGAAAGNSAMTVLARALVIMIVCWVIGRIVGAIATHAIDHHIERYKQEHPIPEARPSAASTNDTDAPQPHLADAEHAVEDTRTAA